MAANTKEINLLIDKIYRDNYSKILSILLKSFGAGEIDLAESAVQEAFSRAMEKWESKIPLNPVGWIVTVAKNYVIDDHRLRKKHSKQERKIFEKHASEHEVDQDNYGQDQREAIDDQLKLVFMSCHPALTRKSQVALTLKIVGGFSVGEISRAFLSADEATRKLITRAKQKIKEAKIPFEMPDQSEISSRLDSVLDVIYLIFNEGYSTYEGNRLINEELCDEAIRLCSLFLDEGFENMPKITSVKALLALMLFQSSRLAARTNEQGNIITLEKQDRTKWDKDRINMGMKLLHESATGDELTSFHLQATIASYHAIAFSYETADWEKILLSYDKLYKINPSPIILLNKAVAIFYAISAEAAIEELKKIENEPLLKNYSYFYATYANFYEKLNDNEKAKVYYKKALELTRNEKEKKFIQDQLKKC